jgi:hypothetical protein
VARLRQERVNPTSNPAQGPLPPRVSPRKISSKPPSYSVNQQLADEIGEVVNTTLDHHPRNLGQAHDVGRIRHEQPKISDRNATDEPLSGRLIA